MTLIFVFFSFFSHATSQRDLNFNELRWQLLPDTWGNVLGLKMKGKVLRVNGDCLSKGISIYGDESKKSDPILIVGSSVSYRVNGSYCLASRAPGVQVESYYECALNSCSLIKKKKTIPPYLSELKSAFPIFDQKTCPYLVQIGSEFHERPEDPAYYMIELSPSNNSLKVEIRPNVYGFMDLKGCEDFKILDVQKSAYELMQDKLKKVQENESHDQLNRAIEVIKPCVISNNIQCLSKFFPNYNFKSQEMIQELKACLDYKNLLPHLKASRGKKKICIFSQSSSGSPIVGIEFPEALSTYPIYIRPLDVE